jgi:cytidylate kinase
MIGGVALFVISGVSGAGKSTVARLLAERFERGVCVPGDAIRAMIVSGRVDMRPDAEEEALLQEETDRIGLWLDTTRQSAEQTVEAILADLDASRVRVPLPREG